MNQYKLHCLLLPYYKEPFRLKQNRKEKLFKQLYVKDHGSLKVIFS